MIRRFWQNQLRWCWMFQIYLPKTFCCFVFYPSDFSSPTFLLFYPQPLYLPSQVNSDFDLIYVVLVTAQLLTPWWDMAIHTLCSRSTDLVKSHWYPDSWRKERNFWMCFLRQQIFSIAQTQPHCDSTGQPFLLLNLRRTATLRHFFSFCFSVVTSHFICQEPTCQWYVDVSRKL